MTLTYTGGAMMSTGTRRTAFALKGQVGFDRSESGTHVDRAEREARRIMEQNEQAPNAYYVQIGQRLTQTTSKLAMLAALEALAAFVGESK